MGVVSSAITLALVVLIARPGGLRRMLALRRPTSYRRAVLIGIAVIVAPLVMVALFSVFDAGDQQGIGVKWDPERAVAFILNAVIVVVVAPVVEELTFRGVGFTLLERYGQTAAIALITLAFALTHGPLATLPVILVFGVGLGYLRARTGSVYPGIVVHALVNLSAVVGAISA
ncbi:MAG: CPBP family glutamic-type intramembrane protease [Actinomycetota bacterium]|nr:CPBP family glutamic-type intramembrane protease [Actinomycetota bacterium]